MELAQDSKIVELLADVVRGMNEFRREDRVLYVGWHVRRVRKIVLRHLAKLSRAEDAAAGTRLVRTTCRKLNRLNALSFHTLIETDQREDICAILVRAGALRGFNGADEDITEAWREW